MSDSTTHPVSSSEHTTAVSAQAHPNIALVKYWGKRDAVLNLPAVGSVSITLDTLTTTTHVSRRDADGDDYLVLNGRVGTAAQIDKLIKLAATFRELCGSADRVRVSSDNNFPTAAGLASSASGYAALVMALDAFYQTGLSRERLSALARTGSGSAARSLFGGFVRMHPGHEINGRDAVATPLLDGEDWPLEVVVAIASEHAKSVSSTVGMEATRTTSPFYSQWVATQDADIDRAVAAIEARDFDALGEVSEYSCLKMHGLMLSARPGLVYWNHATTACIHAVRAMRAEGVPVFFTIDAGPQLKAVCAPGAADLVAQRLSQVDGVSRVLKVGLGNGARIIDGKVGEQRP